MGATETEFEKPTGGALQTAKDLFSGAVGGIAQVLIGKLHCPQPARHGPVAFVAEFGRCSRLEQA